ncbi:O-succinylhomoserine sulfhydrylase domain protein [Mycobacteroides abscessus]|nr:O-succinylhomoserine sulfhydrylase domain protein [Mycobacteroides abscessus]
MQSLVDIEAVCTLAHASGGKGGAGQRLRDTAAAQGIPLGADVVVYSGTKHNRRAGGGCSVGASWVRPSTSRVPSRR